MFTGLWKHFRRSHLQIYTHNFRYTRPLAVNEWSQIAAELCKIWVTVLCFPSAVCIILSPLLELFSNHFIVVYWSRLLLCHHVSFVYAMSCLTQTLSYTDSLFRLRASQQWNSDFSLGLKAAIRNVYIYYQLVKIMFYSFKNVIYCSFNGKLENIRNIITSL